jgi:ATP-dependent Clp protease protease subunit
MAGDWVLQNDDDDEEQDQKQAETTQEESRLVERFLKTRTTLISETITDAVARRVYQNLLLLENDNPDAPITVIVNSPGGEADSGFGILDMMRFIKCPVRTLVAGLCASAAVLVAAAADKENRFSLPNSRFLLHQPMAVSFGQASDLEIASTEILRLRDRYNQIIAGCTGKDLDQVAQDSDRDFWMNASQAQEYGLVSRIVSSRKELDG